MIAETSLLTYCLGIRNRKAQLEHRLAQKMGKERWYQSYKVRVACVERDCDFGVES